MRRFSLLRYSRTGKLAKDLLYLHAPPSVTRRILPLAERLRIAASPFQEKVLETQTIFIHVPKAAGSSVKSEIYGAPLYGHRRIAEFYGFDPAHAAAFFKFAFVRNPWDRLLSAYAYLLQGQGTTARDRRFVESHLKPAGDFVRFVTALEDRRYRRAVMSYDHFSPQTQWVCLPGQRAHAMDFLGRFECMEADMAEVRFRLGFPTVSLERLRPSDHRDYREAYTRRTREIVGEVYAADVTLFGYGFA